MGGSHVSALELIKHLDLEQFDPVIGVHKEGGLSKFVNSMGFNYTLLPSIDTRSFNASVFAEAFEILRRTKSNVAYLRSRGIHLVHSNDRRMHTLWGVASRLAGIRSIFHRRSLGKGGRNRLLDIIADEQIAISMTTSAYRWNCRNVINDPVVDSYIPYNNDFFRSKLRREIDVPEHYNVVIQVCNFTEQKRPRRFIDVARKFVDSAHFQNDTIFVIVGEPREPEHKLLVDHRRELGMEAHVVLVGYKAPVQPWIAGSDVLVATAKDEGFGRTLVEAMLCGTPVIASDDGGHSEVLVNGRNGILVGLDDVGGYVDAIARLLQGEVETEKITRQARRDALASYSVMSHVNQVQRLYLAMLK